MEMFASLFSRSQEPFSREMGTSAWEAKEGPVERKSSGHFSLRVTVRVQTTDTSSPRNAFDWIPVGLHCCVNCLCAAE